MVSARALLVARARRYIAHHADNADLTVEAIAGALRCTKRHLHRAFAEQGETVFAYIWAVRLERCRSDLDHMSGVTSSITEIAFSWGFNSSSHFSRMFKARFGVPPRVYRAGIARPAASILPPTLSASLSRE